MGFLSFSFKAVISNVHSGHPSPDRYRVQQATERVKANNQNKTDKDRKNTDEKAARF
jgi:hypothetical protein